MWVLAKHNLPCITFSIHVHVHVGEVYTCIMLYMTLTFIPDEPRGTIIFNQFLLPLPRVSTRDVVAMKVWVPEYLNKDGTSGGPLLYTVGIN